MGSDDTSRDVCLYTLSGHGRGAGGSGDGGAADEAAAGCSGARPGRGTDGGGGRPALLSLLAKTEPFGRGAAGRSAAKEVAWLGVGTGTGGGEDFASGRDTGFGSGTGGGGARSRGAAVLRVRGTGGGGPGAVPSPPSTTLRGTAGGGTDTGTGTVGKPIGGATTGAGGATVGGATVNGTGTVGGGTGAAVRATALRDDGTPTAGAAPRASLLFFIPETATGGGGSMADALGCEARARERPVTTSGGTPEEVEAAAAAAAAAGAAEAGATPPTRGCSPAAGRGILAAAGGVLPSMTSRHFTALSAAAKSKLMRERSLSWRCMITSLRDSICVGEWGPGGWVCAEWW